MISKLKINDWTTAQHSCLMILFCYQIYIQGTGLWQTCFYVDKFLWQHLNEYFCNAMVYEKVLWQLLFVSAILKCNKCYHLKKNLWAWSFYEKALFLMVSVIFWWSIERCWKVLWKLWLGLGRNFYNMTRSEEVFIQNLRRQLLGSW